MPRKSKFADFNFAAFPLVASNSFLMGNDQRRKQEAKRFVKMVRIHGAVPTYPR